MTHDEIIAVVAAHAAGEEIQGRYNGNRIRVESAYPWQDTPKPSWNFADCDFRVKPKPPKPREWWAVEFSSGPARMYPNKETAIHAGYGSGFGGRDVAPILVREVLPEPSQ